MITDVASIHEAAKAVGLPVVSVRLAKNAGPFEIVLAATATKQQRADASTLAASASKGMATVDVAGMTCCVQRSAYSVLDALAILAALDGTEDERKEAQGVIAVHVARLRGK